MNITTRHIIAALFVILAGGVFLYTLITNVWFVPSSGPVPAQPIPLSEVATSSLPARLIVPALHINAHVQDVGVNSQGNMQAPSNLTDVAWYKDGTVPGMIGSAVIAGHVNNGLGLGGVFADLNTLKKGDDIYIQTMGGAMLHFVVSDTEVYPYQSVPLTTLFNRNDTSRLNLITCTGGWVGDQDTYDHRMVIYTTLVS